MSDRALVAVSAATGWLCGETTWRDDRRRPATGWRPLAASPPEAETFSSLVDWLDFARFEGVYRAARDAWTPLLACWTAVEPLLEEPYHDPRGDGALVAIRSASDAAALRTWFRAAKGTVADSVRTGELSRADARGELLAGLRRRAGEREVVAGRQARQ